MDRPVSLAWQLITHAPILKSACLRCAGDVVANYRPSTHTLAVAFPASVRKFKAQHAVVLTGRYRLSGSKTAAFMSKPIRVC